MLRQGVLIIPLAPRTPGAAPRGRGAAWVPFVMLVVSISVEPVPAAPEVERVALDNGLSVTLYTADRLRDGLTTFDGQPAIRLDDGRLIPVVTDISDPSIVNKGDGRFHPFPREMVVAALEAIEHRRLDMPVTVYLLPYPRRAVLTSSTVGNEVFLSPHVLPIDPATAAYIVAHETGHAFHNRFLPDDSSAWRQYRSLRGIADPLKFSESSSHAYRPKEIFAEDFRVLFGGPEAHFGGYVENPELSSPELVGGLAHFMTRIATVGSARGFARGTVP